MIIDCFQFFNELDLLEIRLNSLAQYVHHFVLVESQYTHQGNLKPLYFIENKERFSRFNITNLVSRKCDHVLSEYGANAYGMASDKFQRECLMRGIRSADPEDTILISDLDEIPDLTNYKEGTEGVFRQKKYYYYFNVFTGKNNWKGTIASKKKNIKTLNDLRDRRNRLFSIGSGWHFSTLGSAENIVHKVESFAHQDLNTTEVKNKIAENRKNLIDPYNRVWGNRPRTLTVQMPSGPKWLLDNKDKYKDLWI